MDTKKVSNKKSAKKIEAKQKLALVDMTAAELVANAKQLKESINQASLERIAGKAKNVRLAYTHRKQLAKTLTILKVKQNG